jgi:GDP-D-mannose 3', 5'-epimerase
MDKVLVTGGAGMIGSNLVKKLIHHGYTVKVADNLWRGKKEYLQDASGKYVIDMEQDFYEMDLSVPGICDGLMQQVDYVVHFADIVGGIGYVFNNQGSLFRQNLLINTNTIASARKNKLKGFVYVGTACSFPENKQNQYEATALVESDLYPALPESAYGWSKLMGQYETKLMEKETGIPTVSVMLHNVYGSPADFGVERSQVIPALIRKAIRYPEEEFIIWGSGNQSRAFIHVHDVVDGILLAMQKGLGQNEIQLGPSYATTIREVAEMVVRISGKNIPMIFDTSKPEGDKARCADYSKAKQLLGWEPKVGLEEGLTELFKWVESKIEK